MVYCKELDVIGVYCDIICMTQLTTVETQGITVVNFLQGMECHWGLLWTNDTSTVVYCKELDVSGDYCDIICVAQLTTVETRHITVVHWSK